MAALAWYVNGSKQPIELRLLSEDCRGHSVDGSIEGGYTLVNIFKEEPYEASYICAVLHISDNIRSNAVEVLFKDLTSDNITATCLSNGSNSLTVAVNLHKRLQERQWLRLMLQHAAPVSQSPRTVVFQCDGLHPCTSYNITAVDS